VPLAWFLALWGGTTNVLVWNKARDRVDADVRGWELFGLLERIASETGWQYVEPDSGQGVCQVQGPSLG
jgi:hypothetical protein